jgi:hypothetical protein
VPPVLKTKVTIGDPWVAVDVGTDPAARASELHRAWERFLNGSSVEHVRPPIVESWRRCVEAGVRATGHPEPPLLVDDDLNRHWHQHPLHRLVPLLRECLGGLGEKTQRILVLAGEDGRLLWIDGDPRIRSRAAEEITFTEGALWSERAVGTNAVGTTIALDHAIQVFAASHFNEAVQQWTSAAAPLHDAATGKLIGVFGTAGLRHTVHPSYLGLVVVTARVIEARLRLEQRHNDSMLRARHRERVLRPQAHDRAPVSADGRMLLAEPRDCVPPVVEVPAGGGEVILPGGVRAQAEPLGEDGGFLLHADEPRTAEQAAKLRLVTLGRDRGLAYVGWREMQLTRRHTEILVLLAAYPRGRTTEQLAIALYGEAGKPASARVELFRARKRLEPWIRSNPWRFSGPVEADFLDVERLLPEGRVRRAIREYSAPLLPLSEAPGIVEMRDELDASVRHAAMTCGDREALWAWLQTPSGSEDAPAWKRLLAGLDAEDGRRALAASRLARLRASLAPADADRPAGSRRIAQRRLRAARIPGVRSEAHNVAGSSEDSEKVEAVL